MYNLLAYQAILLQKGHHPTDVAPALYLSFHVAAVFPKTSCLKDSFRSEVTERRDRWGIGVRHPVVRRDRMHSRFRLPRSLHHTAVATRLELAILPALTNYLIQATHREQCTRVAPAKDLAE